jgi:hypothetical protein
VADIGHNLKKVKEAIKDAISSINDRKAERDDINADIQATRENLKALGISKKAFDMAMAYLDMDPGKREGFDIAYALVREVGGAPMQDDLFSAAQSLGAKDVPKPAEPDAAEIEKVIASQDAEKVKGKKVHEPTGEHKGTIN